MVHSLTRLIGFKTESSLPFRGALQSQKLDVCRDLAVDQFFGLFVLMARRRKGDGCTQIS